VEDVNYMLVWVAVQGVSQGDALATLKMELSDSVESRHVSGWPDFLNRRDLHDRIFLGQLPGNWVLLFGNIDDEGKDRLAQLVRLGPAFAGDISRIGNFAEARSYADGREVWNVTYDLESHRAGDLLTVEGPLPRALEAILADARAAEADGRGSDIGVDVLFEVPGTLSKAICGFSPHEAPPKGFRWSMLQRIGGEPEPKSKPGGFFARLFGRG